MGRRCWMHPWRRKSKKTPRIKRKAKATKNPRNVTRKVKAGVEVGAEVRAKNIALGAASHVPDRGTGSTRRAKVGGAAGHAVDAANPRKDPLVTGNAVVPREEAREVDPAAFIGDTAQGVRITGLPGVTMWKCPQRNVTRGQCSACS